MARKAANYCSQIQRLEHTNMDGPSGRHGQNGYGGVGYGVGFTARQAIDCWYDEVKKRSTMVQLLLYIFEGPDV